MDIYYRVEMSNQWRLGCGGIVDLNCGWFCQDALLTWYCTKNRLPKALFKNAARHKRTRYGFNPENSFCMGLGVPADIYELEKYLLKHGPLIFAGKLGLADFGFMGGVGHYVLVVGVRSKTKGVIIYDPLSVDLRNVRGVSPSMYKFDHFIKRTVSVLILNEYSLKMLYKK